MEKGNPWTSAGSEPLVADLLSDPIAQALMRADGVFVGDVLAIVTRLCRSRSRVPAYRHSLDPVIGDVSRYDL